MNLIRIFHTVRHLKPVQIYGRLLFHLKRHFAGPSGAGDESRVARELKRLYPLEKQIFSLTFLHQTCEFCSDEMRWNSCEWQPEIRPEKLWLYHLNYFKWLFEKQHLLSRELQLFLILDWIEKNPSARSESWEPFPLSKRLISWVIWLEQYTDLATPLRDCIISSMYSQLQRLVVDLEYHNQANHLFENLAAMLVSSLFLLSQDWQKPIMLSELALSAIKELNLQINEQFLADGGHYERSPMYHNEMLAAVKMIGETCRKGAKTEHLHELSGLLPALQQLHDLCIQRLPLIKDWLTWLTHPDGMPAQFNDCELRPVRVKREKTCDKPTSYLLEASGFFVRQAQDHYFAMSCGEPSPPFQPGHSHADITSYELSLLGRRCIVDTGCGSYQNPEIRYNCRKSAAHNVALIELSDQSDLWGAFRIGKRARIISRSYDSQSGILIVELLDQYDQHLRREVVFGSESIRVRDRLYQRRLTGTFCSLLHLHPDCQILPEAESTSISLSCHEVSFKVQTSARVRTEAHICYPEFGRAATTVKLILSNHESEAIDYIINWKSN